MSWLFGLNKKNPDFSQFVNPPAVAVDDSKTSYGNRSGFDSTALEKAAKAAKELEQSPLAKDYLDVIDRQNEVKTQENIHLMKLSELEMARLAMEHIKAAADEKIKAVKDETVHRQRQADYQDQLARKRYDDQLAQQSRMHEENLMKQEESISKQEALRLRTIEQELKMREGVEVKKVEAQIRAQSVSDRENIDINIRKIQVEAAERRQTLLDSIKTSGDVLGKGLQTFLGDRLKVTTVVVGLSALAGGIYAAKFGFGVAARHIENRLIKPSLVRETSRLTVTEAFKHPVKTFKRYTNKAEDALKGIVLEPKMEEQLRDIAIATRLTKANKGFYKNILFCGPPGTGKSMFARSLANHSGMDYAIMTGGDVSPMGADGVTAIHKVFNWAETSKRGLLLFIDEADAFLRRRDEEVIGESMRATLNAFLYHIGGQSKNFMLVLASNLPEQFDSAITDRIDDIVDFNLPSLEERERMVRLYFDKFVLQPASAGAKRLKVDVFDYGAKCSEIARLSEGFSGREIAKLGVDWQTSVYTSESGILTEEMIDLTVEKAIKTHQTKVLWEKAQAQKAIEDSASLNSA